MQAAAHRTDAERRAGHTREGEALAFPPKAETILSLTRGIDAGNLICKLPHGLLQIDGTFVRRYPRVRIQRTRRRLRP